MVEFFKKLKNLNVQISLTGDDLKVDFEGDLPDGLLQEIRQSKQQIIAYLKELRGHREYELIPQAPVADDYVLSPAQERLWRISQVKNANIAYNIVYAYSVSDRIDVSAFEHACRELIARHEVLRTIFKENEQGEVRQVIVDIEMSDLFSFLDFTTQPGKVVGFLKESGIVPFGADLPLIKIHLLKLADKHFIVNYVTHHIICDGWSMGVFIRDLFKLYAIRTQRLKEALSPLRIQYKDYAVWQRQRLQHDVLARSKSHWLKQFAGEFPVLELPTDRPRPPVRSFEGKMMHYMIDKKLSAQFKTSISEKRGTLFMGLLTVVYTLLYKYTGQEDIIVGSPVAGRDDSDLENQIGMYVNTLGLRAQFSGNDTFYQLLESVKNNTLEAYRHSAYPFDSLINDLQIQIDPSRNALFDVMVVLHNDDIKNENNRLQSASDFVVKAYNNTGAEYTTSKYDLIFFFTETEDGIQCGFEYSADLFYKETIERMCRHTSQIMRQVAANDSAILADLTWIGDRDLREILVDFNCTSVPYPRDKSLVQLFESQVLMTPDNIAVRSGRDFLTYLELNAEANRLAHYLRTVYAITPGMCIGIKLDRGIEMIFGILATLKAGGAYVPIDPANPLERCEFMRTDSRCKVMLDEKELVKYSKVRDEFGKENPTLANASDDLAYVMYTSGTTGNPKGVMVLHKNVIRLVKNTNYISIDEKDCLLSLSNFSFDGSTFDIFGALLNGATLVVPDREEILNLPNLCRLIEQAQVSIFFVTTALFNSLLDENFHQASKLRCILFGGELVSVSHVERCRSRYPHIRLVHVYGPTENTTFSTYYEVGDIQESSITIPIGKSIANTTSYILDKHQHPQAIGVYGELYVGGEGLTAGYLNNEELTQHKFIRNPFVKNERLYRTGDVARWLPGGDIEFLGRNDEQVKIRGYRVELAEIERCLSGYTEVDDVILVATQVPGSARELVAYFTTKSRFNVSELRKHAEKYLPAYMVPRYYVTMERFPLTLNGKVDKKAFPIVQAQHLATGKEFVAPRNEIEETLVAIWSQVLTIDKIAIGVNDDFFMLGGHSLKATQVLAKVRESLKINLSVRDVFAETTIEKLALEINRKKWVLDQRQNTGKEEDTVMTL